jgi:hypothetical protein
LTSPKGSDYIPIDVPGFPGMPFEPKRSREDPWRKSTWNRSWERSSQDGRRTWFSTIIKGEDFLFVMEGCLAFRGNERIIELEAGDGLYFDSAILHAVGALDDRNAKVMAVWHTSPEA